MHFTPSLTALALSLAMAFPALAVECSNTGGQYEAWKPVMAQRPQRRVWARRVSRR